jgi:uncharacterized protein involved in exopolysaccharide biosynthesis
MRDDELTIEPYRPRPLPSARDIVAVLFRQRWPMLITFVLVVIAAVASGRWSPKYEAEMKIMVRRQRADAIVSPSANAPDAGGDQVSEEYLNSEVELLNSEDLLRKVALETGLSGTSGTSNDHASDVKTAVAVRKLAKELEIKPLRKTNVISISYQNRDPKMAAGVLNALAAAYLEKHLEVHRPSGELNFFDQQATQYQQRLDKAQDNLTDFTKQTHVVSADLERDAALHQANDFDATARQAATAAAETNQRINSLNKQLQDMQSRVTTVKHTSANAALLQQLESTLLGQQLKRTELLTKFEPTYRLVQEVDQEIAETEKAIADTRSQPMQDESTDLNPNYQLVQAELTKDRAELSGLQARAADAGFNAEQYRKHAEQLEQDGVVQQELLLDAKTQEDSYLLYAHKREEARISNALDQRGILNVAVAEQPIVPALPNGSPLSAALITFMLAGGLSLSAAFVCDLADSSFRTPDEVTRYLGTPVLAALPKSVE